MRPQILRSGEVILRKPLMTLRRVHIGGAAARHECPESIHVRAVAVDFLTEVDENI